MLHIYICMYDEWALVHFRTLVTLRRVRVGLELAKQSACIALYYRNTKLQLRV